MMKIGTASQSTVFALRRKKTLSVCSSLAFAVLWATTTSFRTVCTCLPADTYEEEKCAGIPFFAVAATFPAVDAVLLFVFDPDDGVACLSRGPVYVEAENETEG